MLTTKQGQLLSTYVKDYVIFDLETTGISSNYDEVVEISAIKVENGEVIEEFSHLVNPGRPIPFHASQVNGITDKMVAKEPFFDDVLEEFITFIGDYPLVGHNIHSFDMKFIYRDCLKFFGQVPDNDYIDTLKLAKGCLPQLSHHRLTDLAAFYHISTEGAHRALNDCRMNQRVFEELAKEPLFGTTTQTRKKTATSKTAKEASSKVTKAVSERNNLTAASKTAKEASSKVTKAVSDMSDSMVKSENEKEKISGRSSQGLLARPEKRLSGHVTKEEMDECMELLFGGTRVHGVGSSSGNSTAIALRKKRDENEMNRVYTKQPVSKSNTRKDVDNDKKCPFCGMVLKKRSGRYGEFWGCSGFPNCRYTENY